MSGAVLPEAPDAEFVALTRKISTERGFACGSYKERCLRRRIAVRMRAKGVHTYRDYMRALDSDADEYERLLEALTINVTKFFRNGDVYEAMARIVVPELWSRRERVRVWSAGCASGEEPYSIGALFHRHARERQQLERLSTLEIVATDIDARILEMARAGRYEASAFTETPADLRAAYFSSGTPATVLPEVRGLVTFARHDLLCDPPPRSAFELIVCRNVIIYFDRESQEMLFERFVQALAPGGYLVLGKVETLLGTARAALESIEPRARIFRRP
ncbi:MAG TPA: protein-glutamate O-methyltransferase CheR [Gemmatimonadaceae bacterium]|nr:protein-glutamate O-methyltransferase CheR [Gemmatimonadaceae bacterium]